MERQMITVDIAPGNNQIQRLKSSQGDIGRPLGVYITQNGIALDCSAYTADLYILKPDGNYFTATVTVDATEHNLITWETAKQETPVAGDCAAQIRILSNGDDVGTARFVEYVEASPGFVGESSESVVESLMEYVRQAAASAETASGAASSATGSASAASGSASAAASSASAAAGSASTAHTDAETASQAAQTAQDVADSIPEDYSTLSNDVTGLKSALNDTDARATEESQLLYNIIGTAGTRDIVVKKGTTRKPLITFDLKNGKAIKIYVKLKAGMSVSTFLYLTDENGNDLFSGTSVSIAAGVTEKVIDFTPSANYKNAVLKYTVNNNASTDAIVENVTIQTAQPSEYSELKIYGTVGLVSAGVLEVNTNAVSYWFNNYITDIPSGDLYFCITEAVNANNSSRLAAVRSVYTDSTNETVDITELNVPVKLKTSKTVASITITVYMRDSTAGSAEYSSFTYFLETAEGLHHKIDAVNTEMDSVNSEIGSIDSKIEKTQEYAGLVDSQTLEVNTNAVSKWFNNYITDVPSGDLYFCVTNAVNANHSDYIMRVRVIYSDETNYMTNITELNKAYPLWNDPEKTVSSITLVCYMRDATAAQAEYSSFSYMLTIGRPLPMVLEESESNAHPAELVTEMDETIKNHVLHYQRGRVGYIMLTDLHIDYTTEEEELKYQSEQIKMACELANIADIDFVCLGGDYVWGNQAIKEDTLKWMRWIVEQFAVCTKPVVWCKGNHDKNNGYEQTSANYITDADLYALFQAPFRRNDFVYDDDATGDELYFYFDIPHKKTRVIAYDSFQPELAQRQIQWLVEEALTRRDGWSYIFVMHVTLNNLYNTGNMTWVATYGAQVESIISALNNRTTYTGYAGEYRIDVDYTGWTSNVICVSTGHQHTDLVTMDSATGCFFTTTGCATTKGGQGVFNDPTVLPDGQQVSGRGSMDYTMKNKYIFDVFSVTKNSITRTRFGNGVDKTLSS